MDCNNKSKSNICSCLGVLSSIIIGIIVGILFYLEYIPITSTILWIIFGLTTFILGFLLLYALIAGINKCGNLIKCLCNNLTSLLYGTIGTLISIIIALSITIVSTNTFSIVLVGIITFFFTLILSGLIGFIKCILCDCK